MQRIDKSLADAIYKYTSKLKYNNLDKIFKSKSNIKVIRINAHHGDIIQHEECLISVIQRRKVNEK